MASYDKEYLTSLSRKDLQALAKDNGIKANKKSDELIEELAALGAPSSPTDDLVPTSEEAITIVGAIEDVSPTETQESATALEVNATIRATVADEECLVTVKRINKKSIRVIMKDGKEVTIPMDAFIEVISASAVGEVNDSEPAEKEVPPEVTESTVQSSSAEDIHENNLILPTIVAEEAPIVIAVIEDAPKVIKNRRKRKAVTIAEESQSTIIEVSPPVISTASPMTVAPHSPVAATQESLSDILCPELDVTENTAQIYSSDTEGVETLTRASTFSKRPAIVPKMTKTQRMRADAIAKKKQRIENISADELANKRFSTSMPTPAAAPIAKKQRVTTFQLPNHTPNKPAAQHIKQRVLTPHVPAPKTESIKSTNAPNFKKIHAKAFNSSKSIADMVKKDTTLQSRMDNEIKKAVAEINRGNENKQQNITNATSTTPFKSAANPFADVISSISKPSHAAWSTSFARRNATPVAQCRKTAKNLFPNNAAKQRTDAFVHGNQEKRKNTIKTTRIM